MIPPASAEQRAAMPRWMHEVAAMRIPHVVGLPVVDWLYCGTYGDLRGWIVTHVAPGSGGFEQHVGTKHGGSTCSSAGAYYIADMTTDLGRDHVRRWCEDHGLSVPC